ncbi:hypothetical protein AB595_06145 [Massilia sp. WF1]|nr:hypothetical protein AM586_08190 [Massilia sp. WG5]KLU37752.1 hypothetical protein AB595_06145 [Massilia sp. WF1]
MLDRFTTVKTAEGWHKRLQVKLPVEPKVDVMGRLTKAQMLHFHTMLSELHQGLKDAYNKTKLEDCLAILGGHFDKDFIDLDAEHLPAQSIPDGAP